MTLNEKEQTLPLVPVNFHVHLKILQLNFKVLNDF